MPRMRSRRIRHIELAARVCAALAFTSPLTAAYAWGPAGHIILGNAAEPLLCVAAAERIAALSGGESLGRIGLWADEIRGSEQWQRAAPWHYVNIPDDGDPRAPPVSAGGDVIRAIERFSDRLADAALSANERAVALRFLVHFVGDLHQPLHVGRASDRGGNLIDVEWGDESANLHAFWDTHAIKLSDRSIAQYSADIGARVQAAAERDRATQVGDWVVQVFALRSQVYDFDAATGRLDERYLSAAAATAEDQLIRAAAHLAIELNRTLCSAF